MMSFNAISFKLNNWHNKKTMKNIITLWKKKSHIWKFRLRHSLTRGNDSCNKRHNRIYYVSAQCVPPSLSTIFVKNSNHESDFEANPITVKSNSFGYLRTPKKNSIIIKTIKQPKKKKISFKLNKQPFWKCNKRRSNRKAF